MKVIFNKLVVDGAKSIDKPIELLFSNKTISDSMDLCNSNVKAIYGPNGSGKSGIISAMYIYKRLVEDMNGINDRFFSRFIFETINKEINYLSMEVVFTIVDSNYGTRCFKHNVILSSDGEMISIIKEEISILKGKSIKDENFKTLILIENGKLVDIKRPKGHELYDEPIYIISLNLLNKHLITSLLGNVYEQDNSNYVGDEGVIDALFAIRILSSIMVVELNKEDIHMDYISNKILETTFKSKERRSEIINAWVNEVTSDEYIIGLSTESRDIVDKKDYAKYEKSIARLTDFIKIFKPDLDEIIIDRKINYDKYYCDKIFRYGTKNINIEFESTGIKKLVKLYSALRNCANGCIAFVDEMDANLHDVYFTRMIEFFKNDAKGQLCFTTHNLEPIDVLKENSHSLDFISNDSRVYSWVKDGNKSPMNKYVNGLIPYSPFNVYAFDFDLLLDEE